MKILYCRRYLVPFGHDQSSVFVLPEQLESEQQELTDLERNMKTLRRDLLKLNTLLSNNRQLSQALEQENVLMETDFIHNLKAWIHLNYSVYFISLYSDSMSN